MLNTGAIAGRMRVHCSYVQGKKGSSGRVSADQRALNSINRLEGKLIRPSFHKSEFCVGVLSAGGGKEGNIGFGILLVPAVLQRPDCVGDFVPEAVHGWQLHRFNLIALTQSFHNLRLPDDARIRLVVANALRSLAVMHGGKPVTLRRLTAYALLAIRDLRPY